MKTIAAFCWLFVVAEPPNFMACLDAAQDKIQPKAFAIYD